MLVNQFQQFLIHCGILGRASAGKRFSGAMLEMVLHQIARHAAQGFVHGSNLRDDVSAIAIVVYHFLQPADLAFDAP